MVEKDDQSYILYAHHCTLFRDLFVSKLAVSNHTTFGSFDPYVGGSSSVVAL